MTCPHPPQPFIFVSLLDDARPELESVAAEGPSAESRSAAIETLAMCCYVAAEEHTTPREIMDLFRRLWRTGGVFVLEV
jgi:hypothetical protein